MQWIVACLVIITGLAIYFPVIYIRKMNRVLGVLEQIEANTRTAVGSAPTQKAAAGPR